MSKIDLDISNLPDTTVSVREVFGIDTDLRVPAYSKADAYVPDLDHRLSLRSRDDARHSRRLCPQSPRHGLRLSRHRQVDPYRAGRGPPQLALRARQPRQPCQPYRSRRQGCDRRQGRHAGHRIQGRHPALGLPAQCRARLRRIRCRPPGRDVRHPARAGILRPPDAARPEPRHPPASGLPSVRDRQHGRPRRYDRPLSRHAADQPGADGPLVDRHHAELPAARQRSRHRRRQGQGLSARTRAATPSRRWCASPI